MSSAAPGRPQASSYRRAQHEGTPGSLHHPRFGLLQRGFAAVAAVFVLVLLAGLGAFLVTFSNTQQVNSAQDLQGSRAYWAARAGIEWALGSLALNPAACPTPPNPFTVDGFTLAFTCSALSFDESGATRVVYSLTSNASQGTAPGGVAYVERNVSATVEK